jgi:hypothetical protein
MRYPILSTKDVVAFTATITADQASANLTIAASFCSEYVGWSQSPLSESQKEIDLSAVAKIAEKLPKLIRDAGGSKASAANREQLEGELAEAVHAALKSVPIEILDDGRFWRYLAVRYFTEFIAWRENKALGKGNIEKYFASKESHESIPLRLYLRAQSVLGGSGGYELAAAIPEGTDFWRSHILRVRTGRATPLTTAFAEMQSKQRLTTKPLRAFAKLVNRMWANVMLFEYSEKQATEVLTSLRTQMDEQDEE